MKKPRIPTSSEYSSDFAATLSPGRRARLIVLLSGWLFTLAGLVTALHTQLPATGRAVLASVWLAVSSRQLYGQARAFRSVTALRIVAAEPTVRVLGDRPGSCDLLPGSLLLPRFGWLRLELPGGCRFGELVLRSETPDDDWRHLHVVWRWGRKAHD